MWHRSSVFLFFILSGLNLYAQKKLNGNYDADIHHFMCEDANVIVKPFVNNRAAFMIKGTPAEEKNNKVGFIDTTGKIVIKPLYANCSDFHGNAALVLDTAGNTALIDKIGKIIILFARQNIQCCINGLYLITRYSKSPDISIVDVKNRPIVPFGKYSGYSVNWPPLYGYIPTDGGDYDGGRQQFVWVQPEFYRIDFDKYIAVRSGTDKTAKWGVINREGKEVIPPKFDRIGSFINGLAPFCINKECGVIDTAGNQLIPPEYDNLELTSSDLVIAIKNKKSGVVSVNDKLIIPFKYGRIETTGAGAFLVDTGKERPSTNADYGKPLATVITAKFGVINKNGRIIIPVENQSIQSFGTGYVVYKKSNSAAVFDSAGVRKTDYSTGVGLAYPVCSIGINKGYLVYNKRKHDFIHYDLVERLFYKEGNKWGRLDSAGEEVTKAVYDKFWFLHNYDRIAVYHDNRWDIINEDGKEIASGPYDEITQERNWFFKVKKAGKCGLLNSDAKVIVPAVYDRVDLDDYNGYFNNIIVALGSKWTYYSPYGRQIVPLKYDSVKPFRDGFGQVMIDNKWGLVNEKGVEIVPCKYDEVSPGPLIRVSQNKLYGLINRDGKIVMPTVCSSITAGWRVRRPVYILIRNGKTGMMDATSGKLFLPFIYDSASPLTYSLRPGGKLLVKNKELAGVADSTGKIIVPVLYTNVAMLNDTSKNRYWIFRNSKRGVAGEDGKVIIPPVYDNVMPFNYSLPGLYKIIQNKKEGIADDRGKIIIPCIYTYLFGSAGYPLVAGKDQLFGVIDWRQRIIVPFIYESVEQSNSGYIVRLTGKVGVLDLKGNPIIPIVYNYISGYMIKNTYFLTKENKMGMADATGKIILPMVYDQLETCGRENIVITKDKLYGMIDYTGKVIYPCKYTFINCVNGKVVEIY